MAYIRVKRGKFKVEINKKGYPRVFKSFSTIKDAKKFCKDVESQMERQIFEDYSGARGITLKEILVKYRDEKTVFGSKPTSVFILFNHSLFSRFRFFTYLFGVKFSEYR